MADRPVILITGASSGIGAETARAAAKQGWRLALAARSEDKLLALRGELGGPDHVMTAQCDVQSADDQRRMVVQTLEAFGRIDAVFANAGRGGEPGGFSKADPEVWKDMLNVQCQQMGSVGHWLWSSRGTAGFGYPGHADRAWYGGHTLLRRVTHPCHEAGRYRQRGDVRAGAASPCGRERDSGQTNTGG